jgi:uncharacterized membrane protein YbhN (UPF0104 family)
VALGLAAKLAVTALVAWLIATRFDLGGVRAALSGASVAGLLVALAAFLVIPVMGGVRWWAVLRGLGARHRLGDIVALFSVALVVGQVLPSVAGDGLRVWLLARRGDAVGQVVHSVLLERVAMVLTLLAVAVATAPLLAARTGQPGAVAISVGLLIAGGVGLAALMAADRLPQRLRGWRPLKGLVDAAAPTRALVWSRWGACLVIVSVLANLGFALTAFLLARALGLPVSAMDFLAIMPAVTLATTLPISFGGWGVREGVLVLLLGHLGVAAGGALALSLLFGLGGVLCGLPGLVVWALEGRRIQPLAVALAVSEAGH